MFSSKLLKALSVSKSLSTLTRHVSRSHQPRVFTAVGETFYRRLTQSQKPNSTFRPFTLSSQPPPQFRHFSSTSSATARRVYYNPQYARSGQPLTSAQLLDVARHPYTKWIAIVFFGGGSIFYFSNLETVPVSGRRRFNCFSEESVEQQSEATFRQILEQEGRQGKILSPRDPRVRMVERVLARLIEGGELGDGKTGGGTGWEIRVIEDPTANAFVLPGGKVFVYSGILPICAGDDGLAAVLGHEIAHNLAQHAAEKMSSMVFLQPLMWILRILDQQGYTMGLGELLGPFLLEFGIARPSSRAQESEADYIGLMLMSQACYNPEAAVGLWERMEKAQQGAPPEWISTHPSNEHRIQRITEWLPKAQDKRAESECAATIGYSQGFQDAISRTFF